MSTAQPPATDTARRLRRPAAPPNTSKGVCPTNSLSSSSDILLPLISTSFRIWLMTVACVPVSLRTPVASYTTIVASTKHTPNRRESNPSSAPDRDAQRNNHRGMRTGHTSGTEKAPPIPYVLYTKVQGIFKACAANQAISEQRTAWLRKFRPANAIAFLPPYLENYFTRFRISLASVCKRRLFRQTLFTAC